MIIYKCDRCKKEITPGFQKYNIYRNHRYFINISESLTANDEIVHLCTECTEAFDKFFADNTEFPIQQTDAHFHRNESTRNRIITTGEVGCFSA